MPSAADAFYVVFAVFAVAPSLWLTLLALGFAGLVDGMVDRIIESLGTDPEDVGRRAAEALLERGAAELMD